MNENTPLLFVVYKLGAGMIPPQAKIEADVLTQKLLVKLFNSNLKHLSSTFRKAWPTEFGEGASYFLPMRTLTMQDIGLLTKDLGCEVCGESVAKRCSRCLSVEYCGQGPYYAAPFQIYH